MGSTRAEGRVIGAVPRVDADLVEAAAALRWARPDLTAELADHVLDEAAAADQQDRWLAAAGWAVGAVAVVEQPPVAARRLEDGAVFSLVSNLGGDLCPIEQPVGDLLFESRAGAGEEMRRGRLQGPAAAAFLEPPG